MAYSQEEIEAFRCKDMRMSIAGILQALISSGQYSKEDLSDVDSMVNLAKKYRKMVWNSTEVAEVSAESEVQSEPEVKESKCHSGWELLAEQRGYPIPTKRQQKLLDAINLAKYGESEDHKAYILQRCQEEFRQYPTKESSIGRVLQILT